jgi:hypothetical protein
MKPGNPGTDISTVVDVTSHLPGASARSAARAAEGSMMKAAARVLNKAHMYRVGICATSLCATPAAPFYQFRQASASAGSARVYLKETN